MKHILFTTIAFLLLTGAVKSQHINIGIKGGLNAYKIIGDNNSGYEPKFSYHVGLIGHIHISTSFAIQPEVVYSVQGADGNDNKLKLNYVNIPLLFQYMYDNGFRLHVGPQLGILISADSETGGVVTDTKDNYESTDIGITVGMSYVKPSTGFGIDIRYNHGLTNINSTDATNSYNRGVQLGLFFLFGHRS